MKKAFSQTEDKTKTILETIEDGYYELDLAGNFIFFNDALCRMHGRSRKELMGMNYRKYLDEENKKILFQVYNEVYKTGNPVKGFDLQVRRKDGTNIYIELSISLQKDSSGKPAGFRGIVRDITGRMQFEEKLQRSEEKYRNILEDIQEAYFEVDLAGNFTFFNDSLCRMTGCSREELIGANYRKFSDKETSKSVFTVFNKIYQTGLSTEGFDWLIIRKDGTKRYIEASISLKKDPSGNAIGFRGIIRDITERKNIEEKLRSEEQLFRALTEQSSDLIILVNRGLKVAYANPAVGIYLGLKHGDIIGSDIFNYVHPDDLGLVAEKFSIFFSDTNPNIHKAEIRIANKDGTWHTVETVGTSLMRDNVVEAVIVNLHDITQRIMAQEKLKKSEEQYRLLAEHTKDSVWITDLDLNVTYVSPSTVKLLGWTLEEFKNLPLDKRLTPASFKDAIDFFSVELPKAIDAPPGYVDRTLELEFVGKNGNTLWVECMFSLIRDDAGKPVAILGESRDITQRKEVEDALRKSELKYRTIFENAIEGIYQVTMEGRFITVNKALARMAGYDSPEEFIESIQDVKNQLYVHSEDRDTFLEIIKTNGFVEGFETEFYKKDRSTFWVVVNAVAIKDEQGKILYNEGLIEDITIRKHAEEQLKSSLESLKRAVGTTIQVLVAALESRDPYTAGHQSRSANLACAIAAEMGLDDNKIEGIRMAGIIHDIGKLSIPAEILTKPTKLTDLEFSLVKEHAQSGYEMLKDVESPWPLADIVHQHHERINGSGYPRRLKVDEILLESRILAVADVVEAMASHRPYRASLGIEVALEEIEKNKGILYDTEVANACLRLFRERGYQLQ